MHYNKPKLDETTRQIAERLLHTLPKPHNQMKIGKKPKPAKDKIPAKPKGKNRNS